MGKAIRACALVLLLACSANAGTMGFDVYQPPPPPPPQSMGTMGNDSPQPSDGVMGNGSPQAQSVQEVPADNSLLVQIALNLLTLL